MNTAGTTEMRYMFSSHASAWDFVRECRSARIRCGYPSLDDHHAVRVLANNDYGQVLDSMAVRHGGREA